jgi:hypothetical protein
MSTSREWRIFESFLILSSRACQRIHDHRECTRMKVVVTIMTEYSFYNSLRENGVFALASDEMAWQEWDMFWYRSGNPILLGTCIVKIAGLRLDVPQFVVTCQKTLTRKQGSFLPQESDELAGSTFLDYSKNGLEIKIFLDRKRV